MEKTWNTLIGTHNELLEVGISKIYRTIQNTKKVKMHIMIILMSQNFEVIDMVKGIPQYPTLVGMTLGLKK
jgi:hypothetical protein